MANEIFKKWEDARDCERRALQMNQGFIALKCAQFASYLENLMILETGMTVGEYFIAH